MSNLRIGYDIPTGRYEATAPGFHAWLLPSHTAGCFFIHVTTVGKVQELMPRRFGTLDEWRGWIERTLHRVSSNKTVTSEA